MKSILIGLTLSCWILWSECYTQPIDTTKEYCLSLVNARLLIADAFHLRLSDSLLNLQTARVDLLENEAHVSYSSFTNLLKIEQDKYLTQKSITGNFESVANSYRDQLVYYQKKDRKHRWQRNGVTGLLIGVIIMSLIK